VKSLIFDITKSTFWNFHVLGFRLLLKIGVQTYNYSIIILGVEIPLSIINLIVTTKVGAKQKQGSKVFHCNDKNHSAKNLRCA
jgi:hypothetical protein